SEESLRRAAAWIAHARRVYVYAADLSLAGAVCRMLSGLGVASTAPGEIPPGNLQGDVALVLSNAGSAARTLRQRACRVILIAPERAALEAAIPEPDTEADIVITIPEPATGADMVYTQTGFLYILACMRRMVSEEVSKRDGQAP
ncbi:MAG: hypothetical protein IJQ25_00815, partial [Oscillibacter sp.]|nr:hypothetical protein [Oscillibacter sp.]